MFVGKIVQIVISTFRCSAEDVHFVTFFPDEQAMVFEKSVIPVDDWLFWRPFEIVFQSISGDSCGINKLCLLCYFALSFFTTHCYNCNCRMRDIPPCKIT